MMDLLAKAALLNNNRVFLGMSMVFMNLGSRYVAGDLSKVHEMLLQSSFAKTCILFCMFFMGTRDVVTALLLTLVFVVIMFGFLNEKSRITLLPSNYVSRLLMPLRPPTSADVTKRDYLIAKVLVEKYEQNVKINMKHSSKYESIESESDS